MACPIPYGGHSYAKIRFNSECMGQSAAENETLQNTAVMWLPPLSSTAGFPIASFSLLYRFGQWFQQINNLTVSNRHRKHVNLIFYLTYFQ